MKKTKTKKPLSKGMKVFLDLVMVCCLLVAGFSAWSIVQALKDYRESRQAYEEVRKEVVVIDQKTKEEKVDFAKLKKLYPDTAAWIKMKDSRIDYPIVYGDSVDPARRGNEFYLHHLMDGRYQNSGTLFMDVQNGRGLKSRVWTVYGHNMRDGSMFADINKFQKQSYYDSHKEMELETPEGKYKVYPVAGIKTTGSDDYVRYHFSSNQEFMDYVNMFQKKSTFKSEQTVSAKDQLMLFSTCDYSIDDGRYALLAKVVKK
ncbi:MULTISPECIES: class B sortase [Terrabacteria group]|uniref:class B sortase n=1 Tax=Bacillati TaxID=1783272 RepID=UPI001939C7E9|nr:MULTISPECIES: class B sortase [Terrabacteria group]MBW9212933.1 class B sortase [Trueperella sp. zg.1013]QRG86993.1 class B sortase [Bulleidia sp. zg-1006]